MLVEGKYLSDSKSRLLTDICYPRTVDLISYKITELGNHPAVIEAAAGSGDLCGSTFLDRAFSAWLIKRFSHLREWRDWHLPDAMEKWMEIKKGYDGDTNRTWTIPVRGLEDDEKLRIRNGTFELTGDQVKRVFESVMKKILALVQSQITESQKGNSAAVKAVLLAGGFGNNPYLKARIQQAVGNAIIVEKMHDTYGYTFPFFQFSWKNNADIPPSETAVVRGALLQGLANAQENSGRANILIKSRKARNHFGVAVSDTYHPAKHDSTRTR